MVKVDVRYYNRYSINGVHSRNVVTLFKHLHTIKKKKMIKKYVLNKEEKEKCDALPIEKREKIVKEIEAMENKFRMQLERLRVLKMYFTDINEKEKDVYGRGIQKGYKYRKEKGSFI